MYDSLFQPLRIGGKQSGLTVKNRIFMPAMHLNMCRDYMVSDQLIEFYRVRAKGGAGLISVGYATVDERSGTPANIGAHSDAHIEGLARLAAAIHEGGALATVQLNHAGRYAMSMLLGGLKPVAPSPIASRLTRETPDELDEAGIAAVVRRFGEAALRVKKAGYDMVEILAGTGYLISEFLSPLTNKRSDSYGGSLANRMRFGLEVVAEVRRQVGDDFPIMVRLNGNDFMAGGIGPAELLDFGAALERQSVDIFCVNVGWHEAQVPQIVTSVPRGVFAYLARDMKERVSVPVIASHRINDPQTARMLIGQGFCDMVALGRSLIADPDLPLKAQAGREHEIIHCVACGQGCFDHLFMMKPVECLCNPKAGHEREATSMVPVAAASCKKVLIAGGGVAGISAAIGAAESGHKVLLCEASLRLGGQLHLAGTPPGRTEFRLLAADLAGQLGELPVAHPIEVRLNCAVDNALLEQEKPDLLLVATGGVPITPPIAGVDNPKVVQAWDVLAGKASVGKKVAVIGGGAAGVETSLYLAEEGTLTGEELKFLLVNSDSDRDLLYRLATDGSREVHLVEMTDSLGANIGKSTRWGMLKDVDRYGVRCLLSTTVEAIEEAPEDAGGGLLVRLSRGGEEHLLQVDNVVLAVGTRSVNGLVALADELGIDCLTVGDADEVGTVFTANHQGYWTGRRIGAKSVD